MAKAFLQRRAALNRRDRCATQATLVRRRARRNLASAVLSNGRLWSRVYPTMGRRVPGAVLTTVGQNSRPFSTAARSIWQNLSSCSRRRAMASTLPSSATVLFHFRIGVPRLVRTQDLRKSASSHPRQYKLELPRRFGVQRAMWAVLRLMPRKSAWRAKPAQCRGRRLCRPLRSLSCAKAQGNTQRQGPQQGGQGTPGQQQGGGGQRPGQQQQQPGKGGQQGGQGGQQNR